MSRMVLHRRCLGEKFASSLVVQTANGTTGNGELIADLQRQTPRLGTANVVRVRGAAAADEAGLPRDKP